MPKANVAKSPFFAPAARAAYHSSASRLARGLKTVAVPFAGLPAGIWEAALSAGRNSGLLDDVHHVRVAEDAALGEVRAPREDGASVAVPEPHDELVVRDRGGVRRALDADRGEPGLRDGGVVGLARAVLPAVVDDPHGGAALSRR